MMLSPKASKLAVHVVGRNSTIRSDVPENYISTKHVDSELFAIRTLSQLKAAILFPASKLYSLG